MGVKKDLSRGFDIEELIVQQKPCNDDREWLISHTLYTSKSHLVLVKLRVRHNWGLYVGIVFNCFCDSQDIFFATWRPNSNLTLAVKNYTPCFYFGILLISEAPIPHQIHQYSKLALGIEN